MPTTRRDAEKQLKDRGWTKTNPQKYSGGTIWEKSENGQKRKICVPDPDENGSYDDEIWEDFVRAQKI